VRSRHRATEGGGDDGIEGRENLPPRHVRVFEDPVSRVQAEELGARSEEEDNLVHRPERLNEEVRKASSSRVRVRDRTLPRRLRGVEVGEPGAQCQVDVDVSERRDVRERKLPNRTALSTT
jgi:hypothetical protein